MKNRLEKFIRKIDEEVKMKEVKMKDEFLFDWAMCWLMPSLIYLFFGFQPGMIYLGCSIFYSLIRIGNKLR